MERFKIDYSHKNIPIPARREYKLQLLAKSQSVVHRMRWKALAFLGRLGKSDKENYGFKSRKTPPAIEELAAFEEEFVEMIEKIEFRSITNAFQVKLKDDMQRIKQSDKLFIKADKSRNYYKMDKEMYRKYMHDSITKVYKKSDGELLHSINSDTCRIAERLGIEERMDCLKKSNCYITVKDHKEDFHIKPSFRVINPSKSELGKVSKRLLDGINHKVRDALSLNQWKNTADTLRWFDNIRSKQEAAFFKFDIVSFYPSISRSLFTDALNFVKEFVIVPKHDEEIILLSRRTLLFDNEDTWVKKNGDIDFDVPMGCFDGAEVCEMIGLYLLNKLSSIVRKDAIGLYRDDGLGYVKNLTGPETDRLRKDIIKMFKDDCHLEIEIVMGLPKVDFLDVTLDMQNNSYQPYRKPNDAPVFVSTKSNHPPCVIKQIPQSINDRLSSLSSNEGMFHKAKSMYENALKCSGYKHQLSFNRRPPQSFAAREMDAKRKRNIIWYNPPFAMNVKTNVAKIFLRLISKHFPAGNPLRKIFNRNNVKVSYSCTKSVHSIIASHNRSVLQQKPNSSPLCNCHDKPNCPVQKECLQTNVIYQAHVSNNVNDETRTYIGAAATTFKERFRNHRTNLKYEKYEKATTLSSYCWKLKKEAIVPDVKYSIPHKVLGISRMGFCRLCLMEQLCIMEHPDKATLLNKRSEIFGHCRHLRRRLIINYEKCYDND